MTAVPVSKKCPKCGITFYRQDHESRGKWMARVSCGHKCGAQIAKDTLQKKNGTYTQPGKTCVICGVRFYKIPSINLNQWHQQQACGKKCAAVLAWDRKKAAIGDTTRPQKRIDKKIEEKQDKVDEKQRALNAKIDNRYAQNFESRIYHRGTPEWEEAIRQMGYEIV